MKRLLLYIVSIVLILGLFAGCGSPAAQIESAEPTEQIKVVEKSTLKPEYKEDVPDGWEALVVGAYNLFAGLDSLGTFDDIDTYSHLFKTSDVAKAREKLQSTSDNGGLSKNEILLSLYVSIFDYNLGKLEEAKYNNNEEDFNKYAEKIKETIIELGETMD